MFFLCTVNENREFLIDAGFIKNLQIPATGILSLLILPFI